LQIATDRWKAGQANELGVVQASSLLEQLESVIPILEIGRRQASNQLCVLLGMPPSELSALLGEAPIPDSSAEVAVGIPADLIRRRPDVRAAERAVAAQSAQIGVAEADLYPALFIDGSFGYQAKDFSKLIGPNSFTGSVGPGFQWNILNYGRIVNNVRFQDFKLQEQAAIYQQKVLTAAREVEDAIVAFLRFRQQADHLAASVEAAERGVRLVTAQYTAGVTDYTPVFVAQQFLAQQQNAYAQAQGDIALSLINLYRSLGGGWELRLREPYAGAPAEGDIAAPPDNEIPPAMLEPQPDQDMFDRPEEAAAEPSPSPEETNP
jgi:NodT family efflux transporter outer membrane factor (OMF) lipoprotein